MAPSTNPDSWQESNLARTCQGRRHGLELILERVEFRERAERDAGAAFDLLDGSLIVLVPAEDELLFADVRLLRHGIARAHSLPVWSWMKAITFQKMTGTFTPKRIGSLSSRKGPVKTEICILSLRALCKA